jgi:hypothetical protein
MKPLPTEQVIDQLKAGRAVEQWLGHTDTPTYRTIKWLRIERETDGNFSTVVFEVFDDGNPETLDVYSFEPVDPDLLAGSISSFATLEEAIASAVACGAGPDKFIGAGMIQDAYALFLKEHGSIGK